MLDPATLTAFMETFYGYGSWDAPLWFIGMEEGGGHTREEIERRVNAWDTRGRQSLEDLRDYHEAIGIDRWFAPDASLQRTWRSLIRIALASDGRPLSTDSAQSYQRTELGRHGGRTALIELLPLPSPSKGAPWIYREFGLPILERREEYERATVRIRQRAIEQRIDQHQPIALITYGNAPEWRRLFAANRPLNKKAWSGERGSTLIVCTHHPEGARSNAHWDEIGEFVRRKVASRLT